MEYQLSHTAEEIDERIGRITITGEGPPTSSTVGKIGQQYVNTLTWDTYRCTSEAGGVYSWRPDNSGVEIVDYFNDEAYGKAADAGAVGKALGDLEYLTATDDGNGIITLGKALMPSGGTVEVDATLSERGKAADAKAVGDIIGDINEALDHILELQDDLTNDENVFVTHKNFTDTLKNYCTEEQSIKVAESVVNKELSYFGVPYSDAEKVLDISAAGDGSVKMYLFGTTDGYDAVVAGTGAIPDFTEDNRPYDTQSIFRLHIEDGITSVGDYFMNRAYHLKKLSFANSKGIKHLGTNAFAYTQINGEYDFSGLDDTELNCAFRTCPKLEGITLNGKIGSIAAYSFRDCLSLRYVNNIAGNGISCTIGNATFYYCTSLEIVGVIPASTTLQNWVFMFVPIDAKTKSGNALDSESWKSKGQMCFVQNEWAAEQLASLRITMGESVQLTIPESDNQKSEFNKGYCVFPLLKSGKYEPRSHPATGSCSIFSLFHIHNIIYPDKQYDTYYDFIERCIAPKNIKVTQDLYNAIVNSERGEQFIADMTGKVCYDVGQEISAIDLPMGLDDKGRTCGDMGTAFWGVCKALGWTATEIKFGDGDDSGSVVKRILLDSLYAGNPVVMEITGPTTTASGAHAVVAIGYDADTDRLLIIDSTWEFPSDNVPMVYWCKFESIITPAQESAIWTFDFGEVVTMTDIDNKLDILMGTVNSGFRIERGVVVIDADIGSNTEAYTLKIPCTSGAKTAIVRPDADTYNAIKNSPEDNDHYWFTGAMGNSIAQVSNKPNRAFMSRMEMLTIGSSTKWMETDRSTTCDNTDGYKIVTVGVKAGRYNWTAYYWNE